MKLHTRKQGEQRALEEWRAIKDYEGYYEISNLGNVKTLERRVKMRNVTRIIKEKTMNMTVNNRGYSIVGLSKDGFVKNSSVHRLVGSAFISVCEGKPFINHINGVKTDNRSVNLEWCTQKENINHSWETGLSKSLIGENHHQSKLTKTQVLKIRAKYKFREYGFKKLSNDYGVSKATIEKIITRKTWSHI